jgi:flagellar hook-associated protein 1 FlgK
VSLNDILGSAMSGLAASQAGMGAVSTNIANVNTPGYAREKTVVSTNVSAGRSNGVVVGEPERVADRFLESTVYRRGGDAGQTEVVSNYLDQLQSYLGKPGGDTGLPAQLDDLLSNATKMTGSQDPGQTRNQFVNSVQGLLDAIGGLDNDIDGLRANVATDVGSTVGRINDLLKQINGLNDTVAQLQGAGRSTSGPEDQRMSALQELSGLMNVNIREQPNGRVTIETASGQQLLDSRLRLLSYPTGNGAAQSSYPPIDIRFADDAGVMGASTGETIDGGSIGGKLGGLLTLRDKTLPAYNERMGSMYGGVAGALNSASNAGTTQPAPPSLDGRPSGLIGSDRLGFTGKAVFAVTAQDGTVLATTTVDFDALGPTATVDDAVNAINAGLGGQGTATLAADGTLSIKATGAGNGIAVAQDPTTPSNRAGVGFSQFFGLNDLVRSTGNPLVPSGFNASDPTGFATGQTAQIVLHDSAGRDLGSYTLAGAPGQTFGDIINGLNSSSLSGFGSFALDARGQIRFTPNALAAGATVSIPSDSTDRNGTGVSFSALSGLTGDASGLSSAKVRPDIASDVSRLPLAVYQAGAAVGDKGIGKGDTTGANHFIDALNGQTNFGKGVTGSVSQFANQIFGDAGAAAAQAKSDATDATARRDDAVNRRDSFSGVNIDEELANMVVLQNSYSAAARVLTTASSMYDTLLNMVS